MSTARTAIPDRGRLTLAETVSDSRVMASRQLRKILRRPMYVVYLFVQPVIFVLLFRYVFGGAINTGHISYVDYLMPGIIVMTAVLGALTTGLGLTEDMAAGVVDRFRSLPIARSAVLIGRTAADLATNLVSSDRDGADRARGGLQAEPADLSSYCSRSCWSWPSHTSSRGSVRSSACRSVTLRPLNRSGSSGSSRSCSRRRPSFRRRACRQR